MNRSGRAGLDSSNKAAVAPSRSAAHDHIVKFYETEDHLCEVVSQFLAPGVERGNPMLLIATPEHLRAIARHLRLLSVDVEALARSGQLTRMDAEKTLSSFMVNDLPDRRRFKLAVGGAIDLARNRRENQLLLAFGEMVDLLWRNGKSEAAIVLEELWNDLVKTGSFSLFCAYDLKGFHNQAHSSGFAEICRQHSGVIPTEQYVRLGEDERAREISLLQQRSLALETELRRQQEIQKALVAALEERRQMEEKLQEAETGLREFFENAVVGLHWIEADGRITWANQAELEMLGYSREEYIGRYGGDFHADKAVFDDMMARLGRNEALVDYEVQLLHKDGSIRHVLITSNALWRDGEFVHTRCFSRDITALKQKERVESFLGAIIESADDAIITKTLEGIVVSWNSSAKRLFGYSAEEIIGKPITLLIPPELRGEEVQILAKLRNGERIDHYETRRVRKDGGMLDISLTVSPVLDKNGRVIGASKIARDITYRKWVEAEREQLLAREQAARLEAERARSEAEKANRVKDEFLAVLSHELRTPLNAIFGWTSILASRSDENSVRQAVEVIQRNAGLQKRLIEDLLDMSRILTGKLTIKRQRVDLISVLRSAVDTVQPAITAKRIKLDMQADEAACFIAGDADRLQQVIWNLLTNAVKFTPPEGRVELSLRASGSYAEITVRDSGQGITADFLPYVFQRFRQADGGTSRRHGGLGLGLAVVRYLIEAHGGTVCADSEGEGLGATFTVRLPGLDLPA